MTGTALVVVLLALGPALLFLANLRRYRPPPEAVPGVRPYVSVLVPARDEERSIGAAVRSILASEGVNLEVVVLDDHSSDATASIVQVLAAGDARVRLERSPPLPEGWNGKQHACHVLAGHARHDLLVFVDADVRLAPDALARMAAFLARSGADLVSGVPRQETGTLAEMLVVPLVHFVLLAFLPMGRMRRSTHPAYAAGIGQLFLARRDAYVQAGGHAAIRASRHDGLTLPAAFRRAGLATDLFDATGLATCRMYRSWREVVSGFAKNADEGLGRPMLLLPASALLLGGQVLPFVLVPVAAATGSGATLGLALAAALLALLPRLWSRRRFHVPLAGALLHPVGVILLIGIQWYALALRLAGRRVAWKARVA